METWKYCIYGCGNCKIEIHDDRVKFIGPGDILDWGHNAIDLIQDLLDSPRGIPLKYFITCTYDAVFSDLIIPADSTEYLLSNKFKKDLIQQTISGISYGMIYYSSIRTEWTRANTLYSLTLSIHELDFFKENASKMRNFSTIHKLLSEIPISTTHPHPRVHKSIRQRKA